jgi:hypothetical protein
MGCRCGGEQGVAYFVNYINLNHDSGIQSEPYVKFASRP